MRKMRFFWQLFILLFILPISLQAQISEIISGPFQGATTSNSTKIWMMVKHADKVYIENYSFRKLGNYRTEMLPAIMKSLNDSVSIAKLELKDLDSGEFDDLEILLENNSGTVFKNTVSINIPSNEISDFSFLAGSCIWPFRKGKRLWEIFDTMKSFSADFMMWMGDNIYLLKGEWNTEKAINEKYIYYRSQSQLNNFLKHQPNFAAWDDHDFGPNNSEGDFEHKDLTLNAFESFWANPSYGTDSIKGTFYTYSWQDVSFFVLDGRFYKDSTVMYGKDQMDWLKNELLSSEARVKFIVGGSQFLVHGSGEDWGDFPNEKNDFLQFITKEKMKGIVFLSGDRHFAELTISNDKNMPQLMEITSSPLTSFVNPFSANKSNTRVKGTLVKKRNFAQISMIGKGAERKMRIELRGRKGKLFWDYEVKIDDL